MTNSIFDAYRGVVVNVRVFDGVMREKDKVKFMNTGYTYELDEVGVLFMQRQRTKVLEAGNVGYFTAAIKTTAGYKGRRHRDAGRKESMRDGNRRLQGSEAHGVQRYLSR